MTSFGFDHPDAAALGTVFTAGMLDRGFLMDGGFWPSMAHEDRHVDRCMAAANDIFPLVAAAMWHRARP
jgi:hypothetical protein